jgi:hypothetical protein
MENHLQLTRERSSIALVGLTDDVHIWVSIVRAGVVVEACLALQLTRASACRFA